MKITLQRIGLIFNGSALRDENMLEDYGMSTDTSFASNSAMLAFEVELEVKDKSKMKKSLSLDFKFNQIKDIKKVKWDREAPWYREIEDGMTWIGYCNEEKCIIKDEMFVINRKFGRKSLTHERHLFSCPICLSADVRIRNIGFVNCKW